MICRNTVVLLVVFSVAFLSCDSGHPYFFGPREGGLPCLRDSDCLSEICEGGWCRGFELPDGSYDTDSDLVENEVDNCPFVWNMDQANRDQDMHGDTCDNCMHTSNPHQEDMDSDGDGDACDSDADGDTIGNGADNCPGAPNLTQIDCDEDGLGDACDSDIDGDDIPNEEDPCPICGFGPGELDTDPGAFGDTCNSDMDNDGEQDFTDNCPLVHNPDQTDIDGDGYGDLCDADRDADGITNEKDNCDLVANRDQWDLDRDGIGDACDERFCYVIDTQDTCLDPTDPFTLYAGGDQVVLVDERTPLRFWANRKNRAIEYEWSLVARPRGSRASILHPSGGSTRSMPYNYHYLDGKWTEFAPDDPGVYIIRIDASLVFDDTLYPGKRTASAEFQCVAEVNPNPHPDSGCSVAGSGTRLWIGLLVAFILLMRREIEGVRS
ncbi:MAG: thrombospondin type 3 repeat-containing protein [Deltaproteobacteria bacterium]|nr:thrombospondin type 3 repeat-containing protein [Deltaproteobacteria bacterium]